MHHSEVTNCCIAELWDAANAYFDPFRVYYWTCHMLTSCSERHNSYKLHTVFICLMLSCHLVEKHSLFRKCSVLWVLSKNLLIFQIIFFHPPSPFDVEDLTLSSGNLSKAAALQRRVSVYSQGTPETPTFQDSSFFVSPNTSLTGFGCRFYSSSSPLIFSHYPDHLCCMVKNK